MAAQVTNYQCPNCTGPLRFAGETGQLGCDYCGTQYEVSVIEQLFADKEQSAASAGAEPRWDFSVAGGDWTEEELTHMRGYNCPSCAAEIICDDVTAATSCPYCGNPTVVPAQFRAQLKPDYVIPFKLSKEQAIEALSFYYKGKKLLPKAFAQDNHIAEIKGIYVPFWLFDAETDGNMRFRGTKVHRHIRGNYEVTTTEHYRIVREGHIRFEKVPVDGSTKMPDAHMDSIEPYDYGGLKSFSTAYLPGFLADKYDLDSQACIGRANNRIATSTEKAFTATIAGYTSLTREYSDIRLNKGDINYALLPVWTLATKWSGRNFLFAMNAQTGKLIGDLPVDWRRFFAWFFGISLPLAALLGTVLFLAGSVI